MELITYGWIGSCVLAPTISTICVVIIFMFHVYKIQWKNIDYFLIAITSQELINAIFIFIYSIINLLHSRNEHFCSILTGLLFAMRILQLSTIASLAIDRALILKWPYQYRFSIRSFQIKCHLIILSLFSSFFVIFSYFLRLDNATFQYILFDLSESTLFNYFNMFSKFESLNTPNLTDQFQLGNKSLNLYNDKFSLFLINAKKSTNSTLNKLTLSWQKNLNVCTLHPFAWQKKFNIALLILFAILSLVTVICFLYVDCTRKCTNKRQIRQDQQQKKILNTKLTFNKEPQLTSVSVLNSNNFAPNTLYNTNNKNENISQNSLYNTTTNTTTTTYKSDIQLNQSANKLKSNILLNNNNNYLLKTATSCSSVNKQSKFNETSTSRLSSMLNLSADFASSTDQLASENQTILCKNNLFTRSQPSLLNFKNKRNSLSICSVNSDQKKISFSNDKKKFNKNKVNLYQSNNTFYSYINNKYKAEDGNNLINYIGHYSIQSREDLLSKRCFKDYYKIYDLRWSSVVTCTSLCYAVNHAPAIILLVISLLLPQYWTILNDNILIWFSLIQGILLPFCLYIADTPFRDAVNFAFCRKKNTDFNNYMFKHENSSLKNILTSNCTARPYLTKINNDFYREEDSSLLRIYNAHPNNFSNSLKRQASHLSKNSTSKFNNNQINNNVGHKLFYSNSNAQYYEKKFKVCEGAENRLPQKFKYLSLNSLINTGSSSFYNYANSDFMLLDKPLLEGPFNEKINALPDPRRSSFSCFLSTNGFPGYSTLADKNNLNIKKSFSQLNEIPNLFNISSNTFYQQMFANSNKFEQQLNTLSNNQYEVLSTNNNKFQNFQNQNVTKTNPVYLTNEHFIQATNNRSKSILTKDNQDKINKTEFDKINSENNQNFSKIKKLSLKSNQNVFDSPENSLECPLLDQLNSLAHSSDGDYSLMTTTTIADNSSKKFKCSKLSNVGLSNTPAIIPVRAVQQSKMTKLLNNRKLDLNNINSEKQRNSFSGEISFKLLNNLINSKESNHLSWPQMREEDHIYSKSDNETEINNTRWKFDSKKCLKTNKTQPQNQISPVFSNSKINNSNLHNEFNSYENEFSSQENSLKRPKLVVDDQLNLVEIENAILNSTNLLNLSVFHVTSDEEDNFNKNNDLDKLNSIYSSKKKNYNKLDLINGLAQIDQNEKIDLIEEHKFKKSFLEQNLDNLSESELTFTTNANDDFEFVKSGFILNKETEEKNVSKSNLQNSFNEQFESKCLNKKENSYNKNQFNTFIYSKKLNLNNLKPVKNKSNEIKFQATFSKGKSTSRFFNDNSQTFILKKNELIRDDYLLNKDNNKEQNLKNASNLFYENNSKQCTLTKNKQSKSVSNLTVQLNDSLFKKKKVFLSINDNLNQPCLKEKIHPLINKKNSFSKSTDIEKEYSKNLTPIQNKSVQAQLPTSTALMLHILKNKILSNEIKSENAKSLSFKINDRNELKSSIQKNRNISNEDENDCDKKKTIIKEKFSQPIQNKELKSKFKYKKRDEAKLINFNTSKGINITQAKQSMLPISKNLKNIKQKQSNKSIYFPYFKLFSTSNFTKNFSNLNTSLQVNLSNNDIIEKTPDLFDKCENLFNDNKIFQQNNSKQLSRSIHNYKQNNSEFYKLDICRSNSNNELKLDMQNNMFSVKSMPNLATSNLFS